MSSSDHSGFEETQNAASLDDTLYEMGLSSEQVMDNPDDLFALLEAGTISQGQMNNLAMLMGDCGNEKIMSIMMDRLRTTGGSGGVLQGFGAMVNQALQARSGSMTVDIGARSSNIPAPQEPGELVGRFETKAPVMEEQIAQALDSVDGFEATGEQGDSSPIVKI